MFPFVWKYNEPSNAATLPPGAPVPVYCAIAPRLPPITGKTAAAALPPHKAFMPEKSLSQTIGLGSNTPPPDASNLSGVTDACAAFIPRTEKLDMFWLIAAA
jgi:hypothetical protein